MSELAGDVVTDADVLEQVVAEPVLVEPVRLPVVDVAHAHALGMDLLSHYLRPPFLVEPEAGACVSIGVSWMVRWLVRLRMRVARPMARGRKRLIVGPGSANTAWILRSSPTRSWLFSALATADSSSLLQASAADRVWKARIDRASATVLPRM